MNESYQDLEPVYNGVDHDYLFDWVFHYNPYQKIWAAIPREKYTEYWNDYDSPGVLRARSQEHLIELLRLCKGDTLLLEIQP